MVIVDSKLRETTCYRNEAKFSIVYGVTFHRLKTYSHIYRKWYEDLAKYMYLGRNIVGRWLKNDSHCLISQGIKWFRCNKVRIWLGILEARGILGLCYSWMTWSDILIMKWKLGWEILEVEILNVIEE